MENLRGKDYNGNTITIGENVLVPKPENGDNWKKDFVGQIVTLDDGKCTVRDNEGATHTVQSNRVEGLPAEIYY